MADVVQYKLERMLPELDDLERRGLFSKHEIGEIVKQRRKFEYRLKRHSPLKSDFIAYIDYEKQLDALRLLRKKALMKQDGHAKSKKSVSDFSGVARIVEIYRLATNRFKGDIELWFQYLEFCRERRNGRMKKVENMYFHNLFLVNEFFLTLRMPDLNTQWIVKILYIVEVLSLIYCYL